MAAGGLFASALSNAISDWMAKEGETAEKVPDIRAKTEALRQSREAFPLEQRNRELGISGSELDQSQRRESFPLEQKGRQLTNLGRQQEMIQKAEEFPGKQAQTLANTEHTRLQSSKLQQELDAAASQLTQDANFRKAVSTMSAGHDMSDPMTATKIAIQAAYQTGHFKEANDLTSKLIQYNHYKQQEQAEATRQAELSKYHANTLAERTKARESLDAYRQTMGRAATTRATRTGEQKKKDPGVVWKESLDQADKEMHLVPGMPISPQIEQKREERATEIFNKRQALSGGGEMPASPEQAILDRLTKALIGDEEAPDTYEGTD